jgi:asparagine synthetase B (glutamine-hydrolysing)
MTPLEIACGLPLGREAAVDIALRQRQAVEQHEPVSRPFDALVDAVSEVAGPKTYVEFSGGVDSSLVLSAAVEAARREGHDPPIPVTFRFVGVPDADESSFQRDVIDHLGLREWLVLDVDDELDLLGPVSQRVLRVCGLRAAARIPARAWMLEHLEPNSTLLSGEGGDEVLGPAPLAPLHFAHHAFRSGSNRRVAVNWLRTSARSRVPNRLRGSHRWGPSWLTERAIREGEPLITRTFGRTGFTMKTYHRRHRSKRFIVIGIAQLTEQAAAYGVRYRAPLLDFSFMAKLVNAIPDARFVDRRLLVRHYFSEYLPASVLNRTSKANFTPAVFGPESRAFANRWDGTGLPLELVRAGELRRIWTTGHAAGSSLLLQQAWLATEGGQ